MTIVPALTLRDKAEFAVVTTNVAQGLRELARKCSDSYGQAFYMAAAYAADEDARHLAQEACGKYRS
ncbi:MAG: hypothetical protein Q7R54_03735 [bacterium]|nr:hypothetical protein [bacterium]